MDFETIGSYLGYAIAHYAEFYELRHLLILGRVTSGQGGEIIIEKARAVLQDEFPELAGAVQLNVPNEQDKRHGQAVAAASLPKTKRKGRPRMKFHNANARLFVPDGAPDPR